jgi:hypothetical protein
MVRDGSFNIVRLSLCTGRQSLFPEGSGRVLWITPNRKVTESIVCIFFNFNPA